MKWDILECNADDDCAELSENRVYNFFCRIDKYYEPPISTRVNLEGYAKALVGKANILFLSRQELDFGILAIYTNDTIRNIGFISSIGVMPDVQGLGAGQALMDKAIILCKDSGMCKLQLEVGCSNKKAISFYKKNKFVIISKDNNLSTYIMERDIK